MNIRFRLPRRIRRWLVLDSDMYCLEDGTPVLSREDLFAGMHPRLVKFLLKKKK